MIVKIQGMAKDSRDYLMSVRDFEKKLFRKTE